MKKSKFILLVALLLTICASCLVLLACGNNNDNSSKNRTTVTYYLYEDSAPVTSVVYDGDFSLSILPTRAHCTFLGLFDAKVGGAKIVDEKGRCNVVIDRSITLWAQWQRKECTITFDAGNGSLDQNSQTMKLIYESNISFVPVPEYEGYDFVGWVSGNTLVSSGDTIISSKTVFTETNYKFTDKSDNVVLTAKYTRKKCKVTLDFNDGSYQTEETSVYYGDTLESITFPEKDNGKSIIVEWSTESNRSVAFKDPVKSNITLYAIWKDYKEFKFYTDDKNYYPHKVLRDEEYEIPDPERNGYEFDGWYNSATFSGNPVERVAYGSAITSYYAKWLPVEYEISFVTNGGDALLSKVTYTIEDVVNLPQAGAKQYCVFLGWCKKEDLSDTPVKSIPKGTYGNLTLYAKWHGEDRTVILDAGEGRITNSNRIVEYGAPFNLGVPTLDGYEFQGWYTASNVRLTDKTGRGLSEWSIADETTTLHAEYLKKYYVTITCSHENAGTVTIKDYYIAGDQVTLSVNLLDNGFNIVGFYSNDILVASGATYKFIMPESNVALRVVFEPKKINVTLNSNGGHLSTNKLKINYKDSFSLPIAFKQGYIFKSWKYNGKSITDANGNGLSAWDIVSDVVLVAEYAVDPDAANKIVIYDTATLLKVASAPSKTYIVVADIDMEGVAWTPFNFSGVINGNGFSIKNLSLTSSSGDLGMFLTMSGTIKGLVFENVSITSTSYTKVNIGTVCATTTGTIENVEIKSGTLTSDVAVIGGIAGKITGGTIKNSINRAIIDGNKADSEGASGGIAGHLTGATIDNCKNYGVVSGKFQTGGIVGAVNGSAISVKESVNYGSVTGSRNYTGGICGWTDNAAAFVNVTNEGAVTGANYTGGIVGRFGDFSGNVTLNTNLINRGAVTGEDYVGGITGYIYDYRHTGYNNGYYTLALMRFTNSGNVSGRNNVGGLIGYIRVYAEHSSSYTSLIKITGSNLTNTGNVTGTSMVGGLIGYGYANDTSSTLTGCSSSGIITAEYYIGGIAGKLENIKMIECSNENSTITATGYFVESTAYYAYVGGYAGYGYTFENCHNAGAITYSERGQCVGGIAGYAKGAFSGCTNTANITANKASCVGGIAGRLYYSGNITLNALSNQGHIIGIDNVGGIIGSIGDYRHTGYNNGEYTLTLTRFTNSGDISGVNHVGGLVGYFNIYAEHSSSYTSLIKLTGNTLTNTGDVTGTQKVGGLIGYGYSNDTRSTITGSTSSGVITAEYYVGGLAGKIENVKMIECSNENSTVTATGYLVDGTTYYAYVGGYAGYGYAFDNCINTVVITYSERGQYIGGIAGYANGAFSGCKNTANITANKANCVGGIAGRLNYSGNVTLSTLTNSGAINGADYVGGIVGYIYDYYHTGYNNGYYTVTLKKLTNNGSIGGNSNVGGIIGYVRVYAEHSSSYTSLIKITGSEFTNTGNVSGTSLVGGLIGYGYSNDTSSLIVGYIASGTVSGSGSNVGNVVGKVENIKLDE